MRRLRLYVTLALSGATLVSCSDATFEPLGSARSELGQPFIPEGEPNGGAVNATPLGSNNAVMIGNIFPTTDKDYYSFTANAGDRVYAGVNAQFSANGSTDADLEIFGTDGTTSLEYDDGDGTFGTFSPSIAGTPITTTGTNYVRVMYYQDSTQLRPYQLHFALQSGTPAPEMEPNDSPLTPQPLPASGWVSGTTSSAADIDIYSFSLNAGDTVMASLDLDPTRDGTDWNGSLAIGPFNNTFLLVNDAGGAAVGPDSEFHAVTVKDAGTYGVGVFANTTFGDYHLSVTVHPAAVPAGPCTTYTSTDVPKAIAAAPGQITSTITIPGNPRIADLDVAITLDHTNMPDLDAVLTSPGGNIAGLFTDIGVNTQSTMNLILDDEAAFPISTFTVVSGLTVQPENAYRLSWFDGMDAGGTWTLTLNDDLAANGGNLTAWSITVCEPVAPTTTCAADAYPVTVLSADFEANDAGFTHTGTQDEWARGTPTAAPITTCNSGTNCFKTDLTGTYNASSNQNLLSPPLNLTGLTGPIRASWSQKYQMETASNDKAWVDIQPVGGGVGEARLFEFLDATMTTGVGSPSVTLQESAGWGLRSHDITSFAGQTVELEFHVDSNATTNLAGLAVDDVLVTACKVNTCPDGVMFGAEVCDDGNAVEGDGCDTNCTVSACGNGIAGGVEACDDGNAVEGDGCDTNCTATACGNTIVTMGEACDDGNLVSGDGCDANCTTTACGNTIVTMGEACDDGNAVDGDGCDTNCTDTACGNNVVTTGEACDDGNAVEGDGCDTNCTVTACGNNIVTMGEACDDGNLTDGDGCDANCTDTACGNGVASSGEECDDGNLIEGDGCDTNCTASGCGNGIAAPDEDCDDQNLTDGDGCDSNCTVTACGNDLVTTDETCDDGNLTDGDGCDSNCTTTACGNKIVTSGETCDDGNSDDGDGCDSNCTTTACGNGIQTSGEQCDDGNTTAGDGCSPTCEKDGTGGAGGGGGGPGGGGPGGGGAGGGNNDNPTPEGGCGCSTPGSPAQDGAWAALGLLGLVLVRRRRSVKASA